MYRGKPLVREGGVVIMTHPTDPEFHPVHHPSYIDFYEQVLAQTTDPAEIEARYEKQFAEDEWYRHLYRTGNAYHGVHPFYAWYWGAHGQQHAAQVVGGAHLPNRLAQLVQHLPAVRGPVVRPAIGELFLHAHSQLPFDKQDENPSLEPLWHVII